MGYHLEEVYCNSQNLAILIHVIVLGYLYNVIGYVGQKNLSHGQMISKCRSNEKIPQIV